MVPFSPSRIASSANPSSWEALASPVEAVWMTAPADRAAPMIAEALERLPRTASTPASSSFLAASSERASPETRLPTARSAWATAEPM